MIRPGEVEIALLHRVGPIGARELGPRVDTTTEPAELERYLAERRTWRRPAPAALFAADARAEPAVLLTFDDGYRSFLGEALPLAERFNVHCCLFITTGFIDGTAWPYELDLAALCRDAEALRLPDGSARALGDRASREAVYQELRLALKPQSPPGRRLALERLAALNGMSPPAVRPAEFLSWSELATLDRHPLVTIGAHTSSHPVLTALAPSRVFAELRGARRVLEGRLGHRLDALAYPYGAHSPLVRCLAWLAGYRLGYTTRPGWLSPGAPRLRLPRLDLGRGARGTAA